MWKWKQLAVRWHVGICKGGDCSKMTGLVWTLKRRHFSTVHLGRVLFSAHIWPYVHSSSQFWLRQTTGKTLAILQKAFLQTPGLLYPHPSYDDQQRGRKNPFIFCEVEIDWGDDSRRKGQTDTDDRIERAKGKMLLVVECMSLCTLNSVLESFFLQLSGHRNLILCYFSQASIRTFKKRNGQWRLFLVSAHEPHYGGLN